MFRFLQGDAANEAFRADCVNGFLGKLLCVKQGRGGHVGMIAFGICGVPEPHGWFGVGTARKSSVMDYPRGLKFCGSQSPSRQ